MTRPKIAILTPDPEDRDFHSRWRSVFGRLAEPFLRAGLDVEPKDWTTRDDLGQYDLVLPLLTWGYHRAGEKWDRTVEGWKKEAIRIQNPPEVLKWNADKLYLERFGKGGAPVTPTLFVDQVDQKILSQALASFGSEQLVVKPTVSASAWKTIRWSPGMPFADGPDGRAMIQPYLPAIEQEGEVSLIFLDGQFSHALRKRPQRGDFRVQPEYDGIITRHVPDGEEFEAARRIFDQVEVPLLYARVDLVRDEMGKPVLMELELVEPDLYLEQDPGHGMNLVEAIRKAARR